MQILHSLLNSVKAADRPQACLAMGNLTSCSFSEEFSIESFFHISFYQLQAPSTLFSLLPGIQHLSSSFQSILKSNGYSSTSNREPHSIHGAPRSHFEWSEGQIQLRRYQDYLCWVASIIWCKVTEQFTYFDSNQLQRCLFRLFRCRIWREKSRLGRRTA